MTDTDNRTTTRAVAETLPQLPYSTWAFGDSVAFEGMLDAALVLDDARLFGFVHGWVRAWASRAEPFVPLDCTAPGRAIVQLAEITGDGQVVAAAVKLADYLMARRTIGGAYETWERSPLIHPYGPQGLSVRGAALLARPPAGVFLDCLHFDPPFLTSLGVLVDSDEYLFAGLTQAEAYVELLQVPDGLFDHFVLEGVPGRFGPAWGRGQGWAILGLLDVVEQIRRSRRADALAPRVDVLVDSVRRLTEAMIPLQDDSGHWSAVVTDRASGIETSTAAFMVAGFLRGSRMGVIGGPGVERSIAAAYRATLADIDETGILGNVSAAVWASTEAEHYAHVPRGYAVPWGQGPALLALLEWGERYG